MANKKKVQSPEDQCAVCLDKGTKKCEKCEYGISKALEMHDNEELQRKVNIGTLEGDMPYNKQVYVNQLKLILKRSVEDILLAGKMLLMLKEKEGYGNFMKIVEEEVGIPYTTAQRFMNAVIKAEAYPRIEWLNFNQVGKVYTLIEAPEEDLKLLEEKGILAGKDVDELQRMSVKEMRDLVRKLKNETDKIVKEEVKALETEKKALIKEVDRLKAFDPERKNHTWCEEQMKAIFSVFKTWDDSVRRFVFDPRLKGRQDIQARVEAHMHEMKKRIELLTENWYAHLQDIGDEE